MSWLEILVTLAAGIVAVNVLLGRFVKGGGGACKGCGTKEPKSK